MRFVAGRGAVAEMLAVSAMAKRMAAPWRRAIGKLLLARALQRSTIGKQPLPERKEEPLLERGDTAGKENHCRKGESLLERKGVLLPARRDCSGATGWSLFLMRPLCKLFLYL